MVQRRADRHPPAAPSAARRTARSATCERNALRGPGYWRTDASLFKKLRARRAVSSSRCAIEAVNFFNHVNLGNPDSEIGVPGNPNANAGRITSTAYRRTRSAAQLPVRAEVSLLGVIGIRDAGRECPAFRVPRSASHVPRTDLVRPA